MPSFAAKWKSSFDLKGRLPTAYLLAGPAGTGKKETARFIAKNLIGNLDHNPNLILIAPDRVTPKSEKTSIRIDTVRSLIQRLSLRSVHDAHRVVLIEEADKMTEEAANSLLKTLEEPPDRTLFILVSEAPERLPSTIRSRSQRIFFEASAEQLRARYKVLHETWRETARRLFQQTSAPFSLASTLAEEVGSSDEPIADFFDYLKALWHDLSLLSCGQDNDSLFLPESANGLRAISNRRTAEQWFNAVDCILETERALEANVNKTLALERLFMKLLS